MTSAQNANIVPITLTVNERTGLTLWAPPWEDEDGEEWQGFLGDGAKILMFPGIDELFEFIATGGDNDLSDHPGWPAVTKLTPALLRPSADDAYNLDEVYEWAAGEPDPVHVSALANVVDMVAKIADCCDDGALRSLVINTPAYEELVDEDISYQGREGRKRWTELGDVIADSWERAIARVEQWLSWQGDFSSSELSADTIWDRVGAEPIQLVLSDASYFTIRGYGATSGGDLQSKATDDADVRADDDETLFLGRDGNIAVFTEVADLAAYCRTATEHDLMRLEWWGELADVEDDELFEPSAENRYDLTAPSETALDVVAELADYCAVDSDLDTLGDLSDAAAIDQDAWDGFVTELATCLKPQD
jgi:hypothetical protein